MNRLRIIELVSELGQKFLFDQDFQKCLVTLKVFFKCEKSTNLFTILFHQQILGLVCHQLTLLTLKIAHDGFVKTFNSLLLFVKK
jgi:hypothetical protein